VYPPPGWRHGSVVRTADTRALRVDPPYTVSIIHPSLPLAWDGSTDRRAVYPPLGWRHGLVVRAADTRALRVDPPYTV
jgi:hypothetical protein